MSLYDRRLLHQQIFETQRSYNLRPTTLEDELPFVTRESVREAMGRRNEPAVWHTTGLNSYNVQPEDYIVYSLPQNQRSQNRYTINDYMADFPFSLSTALEKLTEEMRVGEFNLEPKPSKKTLSNPRLSLKEGTDDV